MQFLVVYNQLVSTYVDYHQMHEILPLQVRELYFDKNDPIYGTSYVYNPKPPMISLI